MEVFTPLDDKGSSPARSITKMHEISISHQVFIDKILQALLTYNPQNSEFTNQITKIQNDFKKTIEENDLTINNEKNIIDSIKKFVETSEENVSNIRIDIDQLNKQTNENSEVLTTLSANLQSLRDDFELFKMKRTTSLSPRKKNDQVDIEKVKLDVESLKNALEVVNENYAPLGSLKDSLNDIKKLNDITKKLEDANFQEQIQNLTKLQQELNQRETQQDQQISSIGNTQDAQESQIKLSLQQMNDLKSKLDELKNSIQQINDLKLQVDDMKNSIHQTNDLKSQIDDLKRALHQYDDIRLQLEDLKKSIQQANNLKQELEEMKRSIQQTNNLKQDLEEMKGSIQQANNLKHELEEMKRSIQQANNLKQDIEEMKRSIQQANNLKQDIEEMKGSIQQANNLKQELEEMKKSIQQANDLRPQLEDLKNSMVQTRDISILPSNSDIEMINQRLNEITGSQAKTDQIINSLNSNLKEQQSKYLDPLMNRISKVEEELKDTSKFDDQLNKIAKLQEQINHLEQNQNIQPQNNVIDRDQILSITPEISGIDSMNQRINELTSSQNKTIDVINALSSRLEEQQNEYTGSLSDRVRQVEDQLNEIGSTQSNGLDKEEILQIPEISDAISMKDLVNQIVISQNKTIEAVNALKSKLEEQQTTLSNLLTEKIIQIEEQLNELENNQPNNGLDKEEILRIPEISDVISMKDLINQIVISQNKTIEAVNALKSKLDEQQTKLSDPLTEKINQIEEQFNQLEALPLNSANNDNDYRISLLEEKISNLENPEIENISTIIERLDELTASQNKTIATVNVLNSKFHEQQATYDQKLTDKVNQIEDQLNQEIENVQERDIKIENGDNLDELQQNIDLLSSNQKETARDLKLQKNKLNKLDDQITDILSKLNSIEYEKRPEKKKFTLNSFSSDDNEEEDGQNDDTNANSKLRKRVSKLEKIVAHLMPAEQLKMKMIPIDFVDEVDIENETTDETLRRHNKEISILAKDFIVLSNEVIDLQGDFNEMKLKGGRKPQKQNEEQKDLEKENDNKEAKEFPNNEDLEILKERVNEITCCYSKLQEMDNQMLPHIKKNRSDINILSEKQKSLEEQFDQIDTENHQYNTNNINDDDRIKERQISISPDISDDLSAIKTRLNEITSAYIALQNLNNALVDHARNNEADISLINARLNQMEEQNSQSDHEHGRRVKRVKKYHHRSRRRQNEEEENENENEDEQSVNDNESINIKNNNDDDVDNDEVPQHEERDVSVNQIQNNEMNQALSDEVVDRLNVLSCNNAKLFDVCKALKSHIEKQQEELAGIPKMGSDIRCIKHELRKLLNSQDDRNDRESRVTSHPVNQVEEEDKNQSQNQNENEKIEKMSSDIRCIKHELKKLIGSQDDRDDSEPHITSHSVKRANKNEDEEEDGDGEVQNEKFVKMCTDIRCIKHELKKLIGSKDNEDISDLNEIKSALNSIIDSQSEVISTANLQSQRIKKYQDELNKQLTAIRALDKKLADHKEQLQQLSNVQNELSQLNEKLENLEDDQNALKNNSKPKERSVEEQIIPENLTRRLDGIEQEIREILSRYKLLVDTTNGHTSYIKSQNAALNEMNTEMQDKTEDYENRLGKIEHSMKCLKYEIRKLKLDPRSSGDTQNIVSSISDEKINDFEEALSQIADRMSNLIENSNIHSERLQKHQDQINQQTVALRCIVENKDKYNLIGKLVGSNSSLEIEQIQNEIDNIKRTLSNINNKENFTQRSLSPSNDFNYSDFRELIQKVQRIEKVINESKGIKAEEGDSNEIIDRMNRLESSQNLVIQNANCQNGHISSHQGQILAIEAKIDHIERQLEQIDVNEEIDKSGTDRSTLTQKVDHLSNSIEELTNRLDSITNHENNADQNWSNNEVKSPNVNTESSYLHHSVATLKNQIKIIEQKLKSNFIKINDAHQQISDRFDKISRDIRTLKDTQKVQMPKGNQNQDQNQLFERNINITTTKPETCDISSEFAEFKKNQIDLNRHLKKMIEDTAQSASSQIQNAVNIIRNEINQRTSKTQIQTQNQNQNQNQNPNAVQSDFFTLKKEIDTLKISEIRKEIISLKNEQKRIQTTLSKSSTSPTENSIDEKVKLDSISKKVNSMKDQLNNLSSKIEKNDEFVKNELVSRSQQLNSNADEIDEAKKLANRIVKIVKGHDEKLKKLKDHIDYQNDVLSEITGREIRMVSSRPTTPK